MIFDFDKEVNRKGTFSVKWEAYPPFVTPAWVADTDFEVPPAIVSRIQKRLEHPVFGYSIDLPALKEAIQKRMFNRFGWKISDESIVLVPGIVAGVNFAVRAFCKDGDSVLFQQPAYPPFFTAPTNNHAKPIVSAMVYNSNTRLYETDFDEFESKIQDDISMFILCNPQNPTGRVYSREELLKLAEICERRNLTICSDEIHNEIVYSESRHIPIASLSPEISHRTITFIAPSKTFNIPGMYCSAAIIEDQTMRDNFQKALAGLSSGVALLSQEAALAAYTECDDWLEQNNRYLQANRDFVLSFIKEEIPAVVTNDIQATFLSWMDFSAFSSLANPYEFFLNEAQIALNNGRTFGDPYSQFIRLNFGTQRHNLENILTRMAETLKKFGYI